MRPSYFQSMFGEELARLGEPAPLPVIPRYVTRGLIWLVLALMLILAFVTIASA